MWPWPSGGATAVAITRGRSISSRRSKRRKSAGTNSTAWPEARSPRSTGPKKPLRMRTPGFVKSG